MELFKVTHKTYRNRALEGPNKVIGYYASLQAAHKQIGYLIRIRYEYQNKNYWFGFHDFEIKPVSQMDINRPWAQTPIKAKFVRNYKEKAK